MCVPFQRLKRLVARYACDLHYIQPHLKKAARRLMPQVVEVEIDHELWIRSLALFTAIF